MRAYPAIHIRTVRKHEIGNLNKSNSQGKLSQTQAILTIQIAPAAVLTLKKKIHDIMLHTDLLNLSNETVQVILGQNIKEVKVGLQEFIEVALVLERCQLGS